MAVLPAAAVRAEARTDLRILPIYQSGEFGNDFQSDIIYVPITLTVRTDRQDMRLTLPWLSIRTDEPVLFVGGGIILPDTGGITESTGPGDVVAEYDRYFVLGRIDAAGAGRPWVSAGLRVKFPTADRDRGLGTGEFDCGPRVTILQPLGENWYLFGDLSYVVRGDPPGVDYRNTRGLSAGAQRRLSRGATFNVMLNDLQSVLRDRPAIRDLTVGYDRRLSPAVTFRSAAYLGLSDTAEDFGLSAGVSVRLDAVR